MKNVQLFFLFLLLPIFSFAHPDSTGTIRLKKADAAPPAPALRPMRVVYLWAGVDGLRGIERFGQTFWPAKIDESKLLLRRAWGVTLVHKQRFALNWLWWADPYFKTGVSFFHTHAEKRTPGIPLLLGCGIARDGILGVHAEAGVRHFANGGDEALAGKSYLETAFGIVYNHWVFFAPANGKSDRQYRISFYFQHRRIGPHQFASIGIDTPLIWKTKMVPISAK